MNFIDIKNSSSEVNFGRYRLTVKIAVPDGRIYTSRDYETKFIVDDAANTLTIVIKEKVKDEKDKTQG